MELLNEKDARFIVHHRVTEDKLLHLEKGVRKVGFAAGGQRIVTALVGLGVFAFLLAACLGGAFRGVMLAIGGVSLMAVALCLYSLLSSYQNAKKQIHAQYEAGKQEGNYDWEYRFYEKCYEAIGKNEMSRVQYSHVGRLMDLSGMLVLVEKGNVVRYFMKQDTTGGSGDELADFLEKKCGIRMEHIRM